MIRQTHERGYSDVPSLDGTSCRAAAVRRYFGETAVEACGQCDLCLNPPEATDVTVAAQKALSAVHRLVLLRHKLQRTRPFILRRDRRFDLAPQHGQRDRRSTSLAMSRRRMVAIEFGTCRSGRSGGSSGSVTFGKGKFREENFGNRS